MQRASESTRRILLFVFSGLAMLIVIGLWAVYINATVDAVTPSASDIEKAAAVADTKDTGIKANLIAGFHTIINGIKNKAASTNYWSLEKQERNFQVDRLEAIPATTLP